MYDKSIWRKKRGVIIGIFTSLCLTLLGYFILVQAFRITVIKIIGNGIVANIDKTTFDQSLVFVSTTRIEQMIRQSSPYITNISIRKSYPHTLILDIEGRMPRAVLAFDNEQLLLDDTGFVLGTLFEQHMYPIISIDSVKIMKESYDDNEAVMQALKFLISVGTQQSITSITQYDTMNLKATTQGSVVLFPIHGDVDVVLTSLQTIQQGFRMKGVLPKTIDLRFNKPILVE